VRIAKMPAEFVAEASAALALAANGQGWWLDAVDRELAEISWDRTWEQMASAIETAGLRIAGRRARRT
jgi:hypothetical protein